MKTVFVPIINSNTGYSILLSNGYIVYLIDYINMFIHHCSMDVNQDYLEASVRYFFLL